MSRVFSRYVSRATLGLPRQERLEAAAELRTHLMDRAARLEQEGFSREEAEHLAVKGMGDVGVTNRQLLGHLFTAPLGWAVLAALVLGGGGWWVWQNVPLPGWGQATWRWEERLTATDLRALFEDHNAPRSSYLAGQLSIPARTTWLYTALVPRDDEGVALLNISNLQRRETDSSAPLSANQRIVSRVLLGGAAWEPDPANCAGARPQVRLYVMTLPVSHWRLGSVCTNVKLPPTSQLSLWGADWDSLTSRRSRLPMNEWTVLAAYSVGYGLRTQKSGSVASDPWHGQHAVLYAVMPADQALHVGHEIPPGTSGNIYLETKNWKKDGSGLPRPLLQQP